MVAHAPLIGGGQEQLCPDDARLVRSSTGVQTQVVKYLRSRDTIRHCPGNPRSPGRSSGVLTRPALPVQRKLFRVELFEQLVLHALLLVLPQVGGPQKREYRGVVAEVN